MNQNQNSKPTAEPQGEEAVKLQSQPKKLRGRSAPRTTFDDLVSRGRPFSASRVSVQRAQKWGWGTEYNCAECAIVQRTDGEYEIALCHRCHEIYRGQIALETAKFESQWRTLNPAKRR